MPLVVVDAEEAIKRLGDGFAGLEDSAVRVHPEVTDLVRSQLLEEAREAGLPSHERPQRIVTLPKALSEEDGTLTRGLKKVVPKAIFHRYASLIEEAYNV